MKEEFKGKIISEFVGLNSKTNSLININEKEVTKAKGVNKKIRHKEFVDVFFNKKLIRHNLKRIQSKSHKFGTYDVCKISLSCFEIKDVLDNGVNTLAYFIKT